MLKRNILRFLRPLSKAPRTSVLIVHVNTKKNHILIYILFGPRREKTCLPWFANNTGADQPAHPRSLISAFGILFLESIISRLATSEISIFLLVAEQVGLNLTLSETQRQVFSQRGSLNDTLPFIQTTANLYKKTGLADTLLACLHHSVIS